MAAPPLLVAAPAGISSVTSPWPAGVTSTVQVALSEVLRLAAVPFVTVRSESSKPLTGWLNAMVKAIGLALVGLGEEVDVETPRPSVDFSIWVVTSGPAAPSFEMIRSARVSVPSGSGETSIPETGCGSLTMGPCPATGVPPPLLVIS